MSPTTTRPVPATLCYIRRGGRTLMLRRDKKPGDHHKGKYNGLGGKLEPGESPEDCVVREVREESGLELAAPRLRGVLTFPSFKDGEDWIVFVFTADRFSGDLIDSPEGTLEWVDDGKLTDLPLWEGDKVFLPWLDGDRFFSGRFEYAGGRLVGHREAFY